MTTDPRTNLEKLMQHAYVDRPEDIRAYLIGMDGLFEPANVPEWLFAYAVDRRDDPAWANSVRHMLYHFAIPWSHQTRGILERILETCTERHLRWCAEWGLEALDEWERLRDPGPDTPSSPISRGHRPPWTPPPMRFPDAVAIPSPGEESNGPNQEP